jgi:hypothetical protein
MSYGYNRNWKLPWRVPQEVVDISAKAFEEYVNRELRL